MQNDDRFDLLVLDGDVSDVNDPTTSALRYNNLSWEQSVQLAGLSFREGYVVVIWKKTEEE